MSTEDNQPTAVFDTSAILDLLKAAPRRSARQELEAAIRSRVGNDPVCGFHPITLAELASNTHEEVLQSKTRRQLRSRLDLATDCKRHQLALEALRHSVRGEWHEAIPFRMVPLTPSLGSYYRLSKERGDFRNLRCLEHLGVVPVATMVDHQILSLAGSLKASGASVIFVSGDKELLAAAHGLGMDWVDSKNPTRVKPLPWKSCQQDSSCVSGCFDGVAACEVMFAGQSGAQ